MRGDANQQATMLTAITPDAKLPHDHPIRAIKPIVDLRCAICRRSSTPCTPGWAARRSR
jgi:hypothetical protein